MNTTQDKGKLIVSRYVAESINQLIAGRFSHEGLRQLYAADEQDVLSEIQRSQFFNCLLICFDVQAT